jgi:hypothetical protein
LFYTDAQIDNEVMQYSVFSIDGAGGRSKLPRAGQDEPGIAMHDRVPRFSSKVLSQCLLQVINARVFGIVSSIEMRWH